MTQGFETAAGIAEACRVREDFQWLAGGLCLCGQTLLNFLTRTLYVLPALWVQVLHAMQAAGLVDLSLVAEDGTKIRANASPRSFQTLDRVEATIDDLSQQLQRRLAQVVQQTPEQTDRRAAAEIGALRARLARARRAVTELGVRIARRAPRVPTERDDGPGSEQRSTPQIRHFDQGRFIHHAERDALVCPVGEELRYIGEYRAGKGDRTYRLYGRRDCGECELKARCTKGRGRRVKVYPDQPTAVETPKAPVQDPVRIATAGSGPGQQPDERPEPTASLTEPEAAWMLATSRKRWEPSFNADISVTRDGIIVSQFLTNDCTDYHHFAPAVDFVQTTLGKPAAWVGDGHYGTEDNLVRADREGILLYAPRRGAREASQGPDIAPVEQSQPPSGGIEARLFQKEDFRPCPETNVLVCPAGEELRYIGEYSNGHLRGSYRLYGRRDCVSCPLKERCTHGEGRRVKIPVTIAARAPPHGSLPEDIGADSPPPAEVVRVLQAHKQRMEQQGAELIKLRGCTSETANAHLHKHGLGRFHVRGQARCGAVLTLACVAHNVRKWAAATAATALLAS